MKYRLGRKQKRALLDENGKEVALFRIGQEEVAQEVCKLLNVKSLLPVVSRSAMTSKEIVSVLRTKTEDERLEIISEFCKCCGSEDNSCQCWNDE